ncbi:hypothetical protein VTO73DRAFT_2175 [Trametes versicolor]
MDALTEDFSALKAAGQEWFDARHDGVVHNPLGAAGYVYEKELAKPLLRDLGLIPVSARFPSPVVSQASSCARTSSTHVPSNDADSDSDSGNSSEYNATSSTLFIHIGAQPNNSPHAGTIITFALAFLLGRLFKREYAKLRAHSLAASPSDAALWVDELRVVVQLDLVDTAPDKEETIELGGIAYQRSHRETGKMNNFLGDYKRLIADLHAFVGGEVDHAIAYQEDLMRMPATRDAIRTLILDRERLAGEVAPKRESLAMRSACPAVGCAMADKHGVRNTYSVSPASTAITFVCPTHGEYTLHLERPDDLARLELNTPLRNLARALVYMADTAESRVSSQAAPTRLHMRVTGSDYAGQYQERLFFRQMSKLEQVAEPAMRNAIDFPLIVYAPLITDWSGAKLSKSSLYVGKNAYEYMPAQEKNRVAAYATMTEKERQMLFGMVEGWVREPTKLFRSYSVEYLRLMFEKAARSADDATTSKEVSD